MLKDKTIVVIGGTSGIGLSAAKAFTEAGAKVVAVGRNEQKCKETQQVLGEAGVVYQGDAQNANTSIAAINLALEKFGAFNGLYHVAGGSGRRMGDGPLHELTLTGWEETIRLNLTAAMLSNQAAVKTFLKLNKGGTILNMGSVLGFSPSPKYFVTHAYAAAKAAIIGFTKSIAAYYAANNIRINLVTPALVETPMAQRAAGDEEILAFIKTKQPLDQGRIGIPEDLDGIATYFMSDNSKFTTGQVIAVDGGWSISEGQYNANG